jgi:hypothetical protein
MRSVRPIPSTTVRDEHVLTYDDVRDDLRDGDVLLASGGEVLSHVVKRLTRGAYSHCGVVSTWNGRRLLLHADVSTGVRATRISVALQRYPRGLDWFRVRDDARARLDVDRMMREAQAHLGHSYSLREVVQAGAHVLLGAAAPAPAAAPGPLHCSSFVARCFRAGGLPIADVADSLVSPDRVARAEELERVGRIRPRETSADSEVTPGQVSKGWREMTREIASSAWDLLPTGVQEAIERARDAESVLQQGRAALAELPSSLRARYESVLRDGIVEARKSRIATLDAADAFTSGRGDAEAVAAAADAWQDEVLRALWTPVDDSSEEASASATE